MAAVQYTFTHKQYTEQHNIFVNCNWVDTRCSAAVQYTFTHKQYTEQHNILVNCNWIDTRWQQYSTHLHTNSTQNNTIYLLSTIGLTPVGSSTVHIYTQTVHRTTQYIC